MLLGESYDTVDGARRALEISYAAGGLTRGQLEEIALALGAVVVDRPTPETRNGVLFTNLCPEWGMCGHYVYLHVGMVYDPEGDVLPLTDWVQAHHAEYHDLLVIISRRPQ